MHLHLCIQAELRVAEVVGLRLYSGPLFAVYNRVQRGFFKDGDTLYTTTAHLIKRSFPFLFFFLFLFLHSIASCFLLRFFLFPLSTAAFSSSP